MEIMFGEFDVNGLRILLRRYPLEKAADAPMTTTTPKPSEPAPLRLENDQLRKRIDTLQAQIHRLNAALTALIGE